MSAEAPNAVHSLVGLVLLSLGFGVLLWELRRMAREGTGIFLQNAKRTALLLGLTGGLLIRLAYALPYLAVVLSVMSIGFLFFTPLVMGWVCIFPIPPEQKVSWKRAIFAPWIPSLVAMIIAALLGFEGMICLVMALPLWVILASTGGVLGEIFRRKLRQPFTAVTLLALLIPPGASLVEEAFPPPQTIYSSENEIQISAPPAIVWNNIREVRPIAASELPSSLAQLIGFPRPIEAALTGSGVGAVRHATFAGGVDFTETITEWKEGQVLAFGIHANTAQIPQTTLDEHVLIGGDYFDVLNGWYEIEPLPGGRTLLHLRSEHRLGTRFNFYASIWSRRIMSSIQRSILEVIRERAESESKQPLPNG